MTIDGCAFRDNNTPGYGAAIAASSAALAGNTLLTNNKADEGGGGVRKFQTAFTLDGVGGYSLYRYENTLKSAMPATVTCNHVAVAF